MPSASFLRSGPPSHFHSQFPEVHYHQNTDLLSPDHGTDYELILGLPTDEDTMDEVIREAIFQESRVAMIDELTINMQNRSAEIRFSGTLNDGEKVSMEVNVGE